MFIFSQPPLVLFMSDFFCFIVACSVGYAFALCHQFQGLDSQVNMVKEQANAGLEQIKDQLHKC